MYDLCKYFTENPLKKVLDETLLQTLQGEIYKMKIKIDGTFKNLTLQEVDNYRTYIQRQVQRGCLSSEIAEGLKIGKSAAKTLSQI